MTQVCLLDSVKLSALLQDALTWSSTVDSIMVSATNGSILATSSRGEAPEIKDLRTLSTTMTAAYTVASENTLVFEAQATGALSVIVPVADHVLLAVNGPPSGLGGHVGEVDHDVLQLVARCDWAAGQRDHPAYPLVSKRLLQDKLPDEPGCTSDQQSSHA
ncbi:MAG: hypothetical protein M1823_007626 [Watsoniomyces obsoletus]|nr:MAG: hypothetical protein M1823_007626 [Watsoniomyces obsoletus]